MRARHKLKVATMTIAAASALSLGVAGASMDNGGWMGGGSFLGLPGITANLGHSHVNQWSDIETDQSSKANSGENLSGSAVKGWNGNDQFADGSVDGGNIGPGCDCGGAGSGNTAGNTGGSATNTNSGTNTGTSTASATAGAATAGNTNSVTVGQTNSGGVTASSDSSNSTSNGFGGSINLNAGILHVDQGAQVFTSQQSYANSGRNMAGSIVTGANDNHQAADAHASEGNVSGGSGNTVGNHGGTASNTNSGSNTGTSSATVTSGAASATNSNTVNVTQTNSGSVSATSNSSGSTTNAG